MDVLQKTSICLIALLTIYQVDAVVEPLSATDRCSHIFYSKSLTFSSSSYTVPSQGRVQCEWRITVAPEEKIVLNVTNLDIVKTPNCTQGYIEVRDGYWLSSPLLGRFCGQSHLDLIISTDNKMLITYVDNNTVGHQGFVATYEAVCGEVLFVESPTDISTPDYPANYPLNKKCFWIIAVPDERLVTLTFQNFDVENQANCLYDYVEVRDGLSSDSTLLGTFCNARRPSSPIVSNSSYVLVKFVSDSSVTGAGFNAVIGMDFRSCTPDNRECAHNCVNTPTGYACSCRPGYELHSNGKACELACGGNITLYSGGSTSVRSPSYPSVYPLDRSCVWNVRTVYYESTITLTFSMFNLEAGVVNGTTTICPKDWLRISNTVPQDPLADPSNYCESNGSNEVVRVQGFYCGNTVPAPITSDGSDMTIVFNSDQSVQGDGFYFTCRASRMDTCLVNEGNCHHGCVTVNSSPSCVCTGNFTLQSNQRDCSDGDCLFELSSPSGTINSPNYPNNYPINKNCAWKLKTTPGHRFNITFSSLTLESSTNCVYDNVILYDGLSSTDRTLGKFCGSVVPSPMNSSTNELYVTFKSDSSNVGTGFQATYATVCGGVLTADNTRRYIYSHVTYGSTDYGTNVWCEWTINASPGKTITASFLTFDIENHVECYYDSVEIFSKNGSTLSSFGKYCTNKPPRICSTNDSLVIQFKTDTSVVKKGFSLVYEATD